MAGEIPTYDFDGHVKGNTFRSVGFRVSENGDPVDLTGAALLMQFKPSANADIYALQLTDGLGMTITDPTDGKFEIDEQVIDIPAGTYLWDIRITLASGFVFTWFRGSFRVYQNISE